MSIDWKAVREDFEASDVTFVRLAKKYGCKPDRIRKRASRHGWKRPSNDENKIEEWSIQTDTSAQGVIGDHRTLWKGVKSRLVKGLHHKDVKSGLDELKVAKTASEVLSNVIKGERLAWGLEGVEEIDDHEELAARMDEATSTARAAKALEGE